MRLLNLGCGRSHHPDWVNVDVSSDAPDVLVHDLSTGIPFRDASFDVIYHSHLLEHLEPADAERFLSECLRVLAPGGILRVAVPDLEGIARSYLRCLEAAAAGDDEAVARHEWSVVELVDQMVRHVSGGRMLQWWRQEEVRAADYILERLGAEARDAIAAVRRHPVSPGEPVRDPLAVGRFRLSGEVHQWMYDVLSLSRLLVRAGFDSVARQSAHASDIPGFGDYLLDVEADGAVRKPDSLFLEARKPARADTAACRSRLKVAHLCAFGFGGAGNAAGRLHTALLDQGVDSHLYVLDNRTRAQGVDPVPFDGVLPAREPDGSWNSPHWAMAERRTEQLYKRYPGRPQGLERFSDPFAQSCLRQLAHVHDADVIHFHWIPGMVDFDKDVEFLAGRRIVWTMHDMNPFTGGCHYAFDCRRYRQGCGACWQLGSAGADVSGLYLDLKRRAYQRLNLTPVAPSRWLAACAGESRLLGDKPCHVIPNGVPTDVFRPLDRKAVRGQLGIPEQARVILFGADAFDNPRKGFDLLLQAFRRLGDAAGRGYVLAVYGDGVELPDLGIPVVRFGRLASAQQVAIACNVADVYVIPSMADNLPNTVLESLACGTPVVAFDVGGLPDTVEPGLTGWLAPAGDVAALAQGIATLADGAAGAMRRACRATALANWAMPVQARRYLDLYASLPG